MTIQKPAFPNPSTSSVQKRLDGLGKAIEKVVEPDGSLEVAKLAKEVQESKDPLAARALRPIEDAFLRERTAPVLNSCGAIISGQTHVISARPEKLDSSEVKSVMQALLAAKAKVGALDTNKDGVLSKHEMSAAAVGGLANALAKAALDDSVSTFRMELSRWNQAVTEKVAAPVELRQSLEESFKAIAEYHAATPQGAEAIMWAYRESFSALQGPAASGLVARVDGTHELEQNSATSLRAKWDMSEALKNAETSLLRFVPFLKEGATGKGHLSDAEVRAFVKADDLAQFSASRSAAFEKKLGVDYQGWLAGKDLDGFEHLADPDFQRTARVTASC